MGNVVISYHVQLLQWLHGKQQQQQSLERHILDFVQMSVFQLSVLISYERW